MMIPTDLATDTPVMFDRRRALAPICTPTILKIIAILLPFIAFSVQLALWDYIRPYVWFLFFPTIFFAPLIGGLWSGIAATVISALLVWYTFIPPQFSFAIRDAASLLTLLIFVFTGIIFSFFCEKLRNARQRATSDAYIIRIGELGEQFAKIAASVPGMVCSFKLGPDGSVSMPYASRAIFDIYGLRHESVADDARLLFTMAHPDDVPHMQASIAESARTMTAWHNEWRFNHPIKGEIWLEGRSMPRKEPDGSILWDGYVQDITDRKQADAIKMDRLRALQLLDTIADCSSDAIFAKDIHGRYLLYNRAAAFERGCTPADIVGKSDAEIFPPGEAARIEADDKMVLAQVEPITFEETLPTAIGKRFFLTTKGPLRQANGETIGIFGIARDITELKRTEMALHQAQKLEAIGQLTSGIVHDFNNYLTVIIGNLALLEQVCADRPRAKRLVGQCVAAAFRGEGLVRQLMGFARRQDLRLESLDCNEVAKGMAELLQRALPTGVELAWAMTPEPWCARTDRNQLETALLNLVVNGRDAMPKHGGRITLRTANVTLDKAPAPDVAQGDYVEVAVIDTGQGIPAAALAHVFEPFFTMKGRGKGTGLGLSQIYGFVKQSNGHVEIDSIEGVGTTVRLLLPRDTGQGRSGHV